MRSPAWVSVRVLLEAVSRLHRGYEALPRAALRRWWVTLGVGLAGVLALTAGLVRGAQALEASGRLAWEAGAVRWVATELPISFSFAMWLEGPGNGFVLWALVLYAAGVAAWTGRPLRALAFLVGYSLVYVLVAAGWLLWDRSRPQVVLEGIASPGGVFRAYPSGHVVQTAFGYGLLFWLWIRAASGPVERLFAAGAYLFLVGVVALGRLRIGVHWPSDLVAGAAIGFAWLAVVAAAVSQGEAAAESAR